MILGGVGLFGPAPFSRRFGFLANLEQAPLTSGGGFVGFARLEESDAES